MTCDEVKEQLSSFIDNELDTKQRTLMEEHLPQCIACQKELETFRQLKCYVSHLSTPKLSSNFDAVLKQKRI